MARREPLEEVAAYARDALAKLPDRAVGWTATVEELRGRLGGPLPEDPQPGVDVIAALVKDAEPGVVGTASPRYFGFVIGGALPTALAADWLTAVWDQNAGLFVAGPSASVVEEVSGEWLKELLHIPAGASFGFVTGCQMAHFTALAAARHHVLAARGWDVEADGLYGAPRVRVVAGAERHVTVDRALRYVGMGTSHVEIVPADEQGRMDVRSLQDALDPDIPTIVCAQAGNVNTGSFDDIASICELTHEVGGWVHVDGAFGMWAAAAPSRAHLVEGVERADSWATDAHKWLNVPYDSGIAFCAHPDAHRAAMGVTASYLVQAAEGAERDEMNWTPEFSRRARGFTIYAALRSLGRNGVSEMVERCCANARRFAEQLAAAPGVEVLNDVVLNQVLVRFGDDDARTAAVVKAVQEDGTCWLSGSTWQGRGVMRISVSNWATTAADVDMSVEAILRCAGAT